MRSKYQNRLVTQISWNSSLFWNIRPIWLSAWVELWWSLTWKNKIKRKLKQCWHLNKGCLHFISQGFEQRRTKAAFSQLLTRSKIDWIAEAHVEDWGGRRIRGTWISSSLNLVWHNEMRAGICLEAAAAS